jgi:hypothetical protein
MSWVQSVLLVICMAVNSEYYFYFYLTMPASEVASEISACRAMVTSLKHTENTAIHRLKSLW